LRVSFLTGKYNWKLGFGEGVLSLGSPAGIRTKEKLVSQYMKAAGYDTHMYGKWHVGMCDESLLPTARGFDTFRGFWGSGEVKILVLREIWKTINY
jgi:arylsulfatase B